MGRFAVTIVLAFVALASASPFSEFPKNKELVFDYKAFMEAGTFLPAFYGSDFYLYGKLYVQWGEDYGYFQFKDLKYKLYNGEQTYGREYELEALPIPAEAGDLYKPFKVVYGKTGQLISFTTEKDVKVYARNIFKSVANIMQLDEENVGKYNFQHPHAFTSDEYSIYGKTVASYNVIPKEGEIVVQKMHEMKSTKPMYQAMFANIDPSYCEAHYEEPMSHNSAQVYYLKKQDNYYLPRYIESFGSVQIYPFQAKSEAYYVGTNITFTFVEMADIKTQFKIASEFVENHITFDVIDNSVEQTVFDIMGGRRHVDLDKYLTVVETMLEQMSQYFHEMHFDMKHPNVERAQLINRLVRLLTIFDKTHFEKLYTTLFGKTTEQGKKNLELFYQVLPFVGTRASVYLLKTIIHEKKVGVTEAMHMLHTYPFYVKVPTQKMLEEMEDMMKWGPEIDSLVRRSAVLSFATLLHQSFEFEKALVKGHIHQHHQHKHEGHALSYHHEHINLHAGELYTYFFTREELTKFVEEHKIYEKYVNEFVTKMKTAEDIDTQVLYAHAAFNTKFPTLVKHLMPIVKGEEKVNHHIKVRAMMIVAHLVAHKHDLIYELYWPIFADWSQHTELRIVAYYILMQTQPPISRLLNMYWILQGEPNTELYHFHYTYLLAMSKTTDPCHEVFRLNAAQLLKFTSKPNQQACSSYYQMDYLDKKYKFGGDINAAFVNTANSKIFKFEINSQLFNVRNNYYTFYFKIDGLTEAIDTKLYLDLDPNSKHVFNYQKIWDFFSKISEMKDVYVHVAVAHNKHTIESYVVTGKKIVEALFFFDMIRNNEYNYQKNSIEIDYESYFQVLVPTDLGVPALFEVLTPVITHTHLDIKKEIKDQLVTYHFDNQYQVSRLSRCGLSFYNPIADVWQGINRFHTYELKFPIYADIVVNAQQQSIKFSFKRHQNELKDMIGFNSHVTSMVFIKDDLHLDVLKKSCKDCHNWVVVTNGDEFRHNYTLVDYESHNTGFHYQAYVYDSEVPITRGALASYFKRPFSPHSKNYHSHLGYYFLSLSNLEALAAYHPQVGTHGFLVKVVPYGEHPITQADFTIRIHRDATAEKDQFLQAVKYNLRATFSLKNKEQALRTWDMNWNTNYNAGHTQRDLKVDFTRIVPDKKDFKICFEGTKKWTYEGINGHYNLMFGDSADGKCNGEEGAVEFTYFGKPLEEQKTPFHSYGICQPYDHDLGFDYHSLYCAAEHTAVRQYVYDIKVTKPTTSDKFPIADFSHFWETYHKYYQYLDNEGEKLPEHHYKLSVQYPTTDSEVNFELVTPLHRHKFSGVPMKLVPFWFAHYDNTHYSQLFMFMHYMGMMNTCTVYDHEVQYGFDERRVIKSFQLTKEWTLYVGDVEKDAKHGVYLKQVEGTKKIAFKAVHGSHTLEIYPEGKHYEHFKILVDGKEVSHAVDYHSEEWFNYVIREHFHKVVITTFHFHLHMEYNGDMVTIEVPRVHGVQLYGHCIAKA